MKSNIVLAALALLATASVTPVAAQVTAFKTGERTTGLTKQCFYDAMGSEYTRTIQSIQLCPLSIRVSTNSPSPTRPTQPTPPPRPTQVTAFKTGEQTTGMTKQCFYDSMGSQYTRTIQSIQLCPLSIRVTR